MARNEEKALTLFNKWHTFKKEFHSVAQNRKPLVAGECQSLPEAERQRRNAIRDITKKISAIQNATLGEHRIRELNDEINKHMRQKHYWEMKIRELGGGDYDKLRTPDLADVDGRELPGAPDYKYYGAAKNLPGVREIFAEMEAAAEKRRLQRAKGARKFQFTPAYYGYDEVSEDLLMKERERETQLISEEIDEHKKKKLRLVEDIRRNSSSEELTTELNRYLESEKESLEYDIASSTVKGEDGSISIILPSQDDIMKKILENKKRSLLDQFL